MRVLLLGGTAEARALAEQLDDTTLVAAAELSSRANEAYAHYDGDEGQAEQAARRAGGDHHP